jgi:hypothetical protein
VCAQAHTTLWQSGFQYLAGTKRLLQWNRILSANWHYFLAELIDLVTVLFLFRVKIEAAEVDFFQR